VICSRWRHSRAALHGFYYWLWNRTDPHMISHYLEVYHLWRVLPAISHTCLVQKDLWTSIFC
jgi:hypothetical protein